MENLADRDLKRLKTFLEETSVPRDLTGFVESTLPALNNFIGGEVVCHAEVDPLEARLVSQTTFADGDTPPYIRDAFERLMLTSPVFQYWLATGDVAATRTSDFLTSRQWHDMALYQEVYKQWRTEDSLAIGLPAPPGLVACFCIERSTKFTESEQQLLEIARPHLAFAYYNAEVVTMMSGAVEDSGIHSILLDENRRIIQGSASALDLLHRCFPDESESLQCLPESLDYWLRGLLTRLDGDVPGVDAPLHRTSSDGNEVTIRLLRGTLARGQLLVVLRESANQSSRLLDRYGLSPREKQVLTGTIRGLSATEIAFNLVISRRTVEKHLENIYNKLGVDSRAAAVAVVLSLEWSPN